MRYGRAKYLFETCFGQMQLNGIVWLSLNVKLHSYLITIYMFKFFCHKSFGTPSSRRYDFAFTWSRWWPLLTLESALDLVNDALIKWGYKVTWEINCLVNTGNWIGYKSSIETIFFFQYIFFCFWHWKRFDHQIGVKFKRKHQSETSLISKTNMWKPLANARSISWVRSPQILPWYHQTNI